MPSKATLLSALIGLAFRADPKAGKPGPVVDLTPAVDPDKGRQYHPGRTGGQRAHRAWKQARRVNGWRK